MPDPGAATDRDLPARYASQARLLHSTACEGPAVDAA
jgi:hypothetical protein